MKPSIFFLTRFSLLEHLKCLVDPKKKNQQCKSEQPRHISLFFSFSSLGIWASLASSNPVLWRPPSGDKSDEWRDPYFLYHLWAGARWGPGGMAFFFSYVCAWYSYDESETQSLTFCPFYRAYRQCTPVWCKALALQRKCSNILTENLNISLMVKKLQRHLEGRWNSEMWHLHIQHGQRWIY